MKRDDLQTLAYDLGLQFDEETAVIFGQKEGYSLFLMGTGQTNQLRLYFSVKQEGVAEAAVSEPSQNGLSEDQGAAYEKFRQLEASSDLLSQLQLTGFKLSYVIQSAGTFEATAENVKQAVQEVVEFLKKEGFQNACEQSGQIGATAVYQLSDAIYLLSDESYRELASAVSAGQLDHDAKEENVAGGLLGAFLGSIIGGAVILLVAQMGYVTVISGMAMGFCTVKGYELLGRKLSNAGITISVIFMVLMTFIANQFDYALAFIREVMPSENVFGAFISVTEYVLTGGELEGYWFNLALLYLFTGLGAFYAIRSVLGTRKLSFVQRKL